MGKTERLNIRVSEAHHALLRRAAEAAGQTISDYVLSRVVADAEDDLADRRVFSLAGGDWRELEARVAAPGQARPAVTELLRQPPPWADEPAPEIGDLQEALEHALRVSPLAGSWRVVVVPKSADVVVVHDEAAAAG